MRISLQTHRWEVYEEYLCSYLGNDKIWLDLGCGHNADVQEKEDLVSFAVGVDVFLNEPLYIKPFIMSNIEQLSIKSQSIDVCSLRFVMEHIADPFKLMNELERVLKPNGIIIFATTNVWSPVIFLPKLLPYNFRKKLILKLFGAQDEDIFPTYHHFNSIGKLKKMIGALRLQRYIFLQDLNAGSKILFVLFLGWHFLTELGFLNVLRSNLIAVYQKQ